MLAKGGGFLYRLLVHLIEAICRLLSIERRDVLCTVLPQEIFLSPFSCPPAFKGVDPYGQLWLVDGTGPFWLNC